MQRISIFSSLYGAVFAAILSFTMPVYAIDDAENARKFVENTADEVVKIIKSESSPEEKNAQLEKIFLEKVDVEWIGKFVIAKYWHTMSTQQKESYLGAYKHYLIKTYVPRFREYNGQKVKITETKKLSDDQYVVYTQITTTNSSNTVEVSIGYRCKKTQESFIVKDIISENFSMLTTQRSEFGSIVDKQGIDNLIKVLSEK